MAWLLFSICDPLVSLKKIMLSFTEKVAWKDPGETYLNMIGQIRTGYGK